jgi:hypothetical protein
MRDAQRTWPAGVAKARTLGAIARAFEFTCGRLARQLGVETRTVYGYCAEGKLASWPEGGWRVVQRADAEWLIDNYRWMETDWAALAAAREIESLHIQNTI